MCSTVQPAAETAVMNREYEALIILKSTGTDAEIAQAVTQVEEPIKKLGGIIGGSKLYGRRRLAYRIARQQEGYYHLFEFHIATEQVEELKRVLRLNEAIVRFLILSHSENHTPPAQAPVAVEAKAVR